MVRSVGWRVGFVVSVLFAGAAQRARAEPTTTARESKTVLVLASSDESLRSLGLTFERLAYLIEVESAVTVRPVTPGEDTTNTWRAFVDPTVDGSGVAITWVDGSAGGGRSHWVDGSAGGGTSQRTDSRIVSLVSVPVSDRARVVALALGEMIRGAPRTVPEPAQPRAAPASTQPATAVVLEPPQRPTRPIPSRRYGAELLVGALWYPQRDSAAIEFRGALERELAHPFWLRGELGFGVGRAGGPAGDVQVAVPSIGLGMRLRSNTRATVVLGIGPLFEAGAAFVSGSAKDDPRVQSTRVFVLRAALEGDLRLRLGPRLYGVAGGSFGVMLQDVELRADDGSTYGAAGLVFGGRLGLGTVF